jgi:hypothetical protein
MLAEQPIHHAFMSPTTLARGMAGAQCWIKWTGAAEVWLIVSCEASRPILLRPLRSASALGADCQRPSAG